VWKIENADTFSARPFLTQAKGPAAPLFYAMVPDIDGRQRLRIERDENGKEFISGAAYLTAWTGLKEHVARKYQLRPEQKQAAESLYNAYGQSLQQYLAENFEDIQAYFGSLDRFQARRAAGTNRAAHEKKRLWDEQQALRTEVNGWLSEIDGMGQEYQLALWDLLDEDQKAKGPIHAPTSDAESLPVKLPFVKTRMEFLDAAVTLGLTAIGICLVLGFCTRLAALGGAAFLVFVLLTQPPWPTIYPPAPEVVGHALIVDKNFVEMVGLLLLASTAVGQWGGLDFFVYRWIGRPILARLRRKKGENKPNEDDPSKTE
jgi:uncharacterized membrane protein YphA (DoxX/SURF4 family)